MVPQILNEKGPFMLIIAALWGGLKETRTSSSVEMPKCFHEKAQQLAKQKTLMKELARQFKIKALKFVNGCFQFVRDNWWHREITVTSSSSLQSA